MNSTVFDEIRVECHILDTGYCLASEHHLIKGGRRSTIDCHALVALVRHPEQGWFLWDTGYAPRMLEVTRRWPYWLYRVATPLRLDPELAVVRQLERFNLVPDDISRVVLSHFHADHVAGLRDFPHAQVIATRAAFEEATGRRGFQALRRGMIPPLLPDDLEQRITLLSQFQGPSLPGLGPTHDLFGDGSARLVLLPGHARGQMGLLLRARDCDLFLMADGSWLSRAVRERRPAPAITRLFVDDFDASVETLNALHIFSVACPDVRLLPSHCPEAFAREVTVWTA